MIEYLFCLHFHPTSVPSFELLLWLVHFRVVLFKHVGYLLTRLHYFFVTIFAKTVPTISARMVAKLVCVLVVVCSCHQISSLIFQMPFPFPDGFKQYSTSVTWFCISVRWTTSIRQLGSRSRHCFFHVSPTRFQINSSASQSVRILRRVHSGYFLGSNTSQMVTKHSLCGLSKLLLFSTRHCNHYPFSLSWSYGWSGRIAPGVCWVPCFVCMVIWQFPFLENKSRIIPSSF